MNDTRLALLSKAFWIWPEGNLYLNNCHAQFRYDFALQAIPEKAPFLISADQLYRLYVNGRYVCRGPLAKADTGGLRFPSALGTG